MKSIRIMFAAVIAIVAAAGSGFTSKNASKPNTLFYYANTSHANPPGTNDFLFEGTSDPGVAHCTTGVPICYGSSAQGPDANNHPSGGAGSVTTVRAGNWKN